MDNILEFIDRYGAAAESGRSLSKLIHGDKLSQIPLTRRRLVSVDDIPREDRIDDSKLHSMTGGPDNLVANEDFVASFKTVPTDWKPQGKIFVTSGQAPKIEKVRGKMFDQTKLYVTGTYADNKIVGGEYLMATGRRRRRLGPFLSMAVVEDKIGHTPEGRCVVKVFRSVLERCKEKHEELQELSGKGSQKAKDEGLEQVARMELMVYRYINKLMN